MKGRLAVLVAAAVLLEPAPAGAAPDDPAELTGLVAQSAHTLAATEAGKAGAAAVSWADTRVTVLRSQPGRWAFGTVVLVAPQVENASSLNSTRAQGGANWLRFTARNICFGHDCCASARRARHNRGVCATRGARSTAQRPVGCGKRSPSAGRGAVVPLHEGRRMTKGNLVCVKRTNG